MNSYTTVSEAVNDLVRKGYADRLQLEADCLYCAEKQTRLSPNAFHIDAFYRFEGETDPADETIVYAISSVDEEVKGVLVNAFGVYADTATDELISKLAIR